MVYTRPVGGWYPKYRNFVVYAAWRCAPEPPPPVASVGNAVALPMPATASVARAENAAAPELSPVATVASPDNVLDAGNVASVGSVCRADTA